MNLSRLFKVIELDEREAFPWLRETLEPYGYTFIQGQAPPTSYTTKRWVGTGKDAQQMDVEVHDDGFETGWLVAVPQVLPIHPICFVAHCDTIIRMDGVDLVHTGVFVQNRNGVLGADDRAGVYAILQLVHKAHKKGLPLPALVFTLGEERGGKGAKQLVKDNALEGLIDNIKLFIEIDRQGLNEYVYYSWTLPQAVKDFANKFGFVGAHGSYSDVKDLTDKYRVPHLNLSAGYYKQHTKNEYLDTTALDLTIARVWMMLNDPEIPTAVIEDRPVYTYTGTGGGSYSERFRDPKWWDRDAAEEAELLEYYGRAGAYQSRTPSREEKEASGAKGSEQLSLLPAGRKSEIDADEFVLCSSCDFNVHERNAFIMGQGWICRDCFDTYATLTEQNQGDAAVTPETADLDMKEEVFAELIDNPGPYEETVQRLLAIYDETGMTDLPPERREALLKERDELLTEVWKRLRGGEAVTTEIG